ncbi:MAG: Nif3-like dinuclear metal center hexameric protein [Pirellulales bacterium]
MPTIADIVRWFDDITPLGLAEDWDNVGLLVGDPTGVVDRIMTCLTLTPSSVSEAVRMQAQLVVAHHPLPFKPLPRVTTETTPGRLVWELARGGVAVYSPHTAFDSAVAGINQQLADALGLCDVQPLLPPSPGAPAGGTGRCGRLPTPCSLAEFSARVCRALRVPGLHQVGEGRRTVERIGIACGSAGSLLGAAHRAECDVLLTGEANFHTCLEAEALGVALALPGHYATERHGVERLADMLQSAWPPVEVWASREERDPLEWLTAER